MAVEPILCVAPQLHRQQRRLEISTGDRIDPLIEQERSKVGLAGPPLTRKTATPSIFPT